MTKNDGYKYAKKVFRKQLSHKALEELMEKEGFSEKDIKLVKAWLGNDFEYLRNFKE